MPDDEKAELSPGGGRRDGGKGRRNGLFFPCEQRRGWRGRPSPGDGAGALVNLHLRRRAEGGCVRAQGCGRDGRGKQVERRAELTLEQKAAESVKVAREDGDLALRVGRLESQKDGRAVVGAVGHRDLGAFEVKGGCCARVARAADREGRRARFGVARGDDVDDAVGHLRATLGALEGEGPVMGVELKREGVAVAGSERVGLQCVARGRRVPGEASREVHEGVQESRHLGAGTGGELEVEHSRGVVAGPFAVDRDTVGETVRVVAQNKLNTLAVDDLLCPRVG